MRTKRVRYGKREKSNVAKRRLSRLLDDPFLSVDLQAKGGRVSGSCFDRWRQNLPTHPLKPLVVVLDPKVQSLRLVVDPDEPVVVRLDLIAVRTRTNKEDKTSAIFFLPLSLS